MRTRIKILFTLAIIAALAVPTLASPRDLEQAMALYRSKQFLPAAEKFVDILRTEPQNSTAGFYAAYSYYGAGKLDEAKNMFWYLSKHCSTSREAYSSRAFLKNIDKAYLMDSTDPAVGVLPPPSQQEPAHATHVDTPTRKEQIIATMIVLTPRRSLLDVTPAFVEHMRDALREYPLNVLEFLNQHNCKMVISPNVIETDFRMQNSHPGGYSEGSKMDNVPALFNGKDIVIGQFAKDYKGDMVENEGVIGTVRHETGHAIDRYMGWISHQEEFKHEFMLDGDARNNQKLSYFVRSPTETFAELACQRLGGRTDAYRAEQCELLNKTYPRCGKLVDKAIANVR